MLHDGSGVGLQWVGAAEGSGERSVFCSGDGDGSSVGGFVLTVGGNVGLQWVGVTVGSSDGAGVGSGVGSGVGFGVGFGVGYGRCRRWWCSCC